MKIDEGFWDEFLGIAKFLYILNEEADVYDVFEYIRSHQQGASKYSVNFLKKIDAEIEKEERMLGH